MMTPTRSRILILLAGAFLFGTANAIPIVIDDFSVNAPIVTHGGGAGATFGAPQAGIGNIPSSRQLAASGVASIEITGGQLITGSPAGGQSQVSYGLFAAPLDLSAFVTLDFLITQITGVSSVNVAFSDVSAGFTFFNQNIPVVNNALFSFDMSVFAADTRDEVTFIALDFFSGNGNSVTISGDISLQTVPEPGTLALLGLGLAGMGLTRRRKKA